jgi:predicted lysophospholipase L1 biosynthesis ABC-type transport system permease subunit
MPEGTRITEGAWWAADYDGPTLVSFDANLARGWGIGLGAHAMSVYMNGESIRDRLIEEELEKLRKTKGLS